MSDSVSAFCDAIREKKDWCHKILDPTRDLGLKWAAEAEAASLAESDKQNVFVPGTYMPGPSFSVVKTPDFTAVLPELQNEARRIVFADYEIRMDDVREPISDADIESFDFDVFSSLRYAAGSTYGVRAPASLSEEVGVFISDDIVPTSLHGELVSQLDALAAKEPPDLHPGSDGKVQDLIHPSLYPFVLGESPLADPTKSLDLPSSSFETEFVMGGVPFDLSSRYAWIPSVFNVSDDGKDVHIQSYINGLGPREHYPRLYRLIEKIFLLSLPHFKRTLEFQYTYKESPSVVRWRERMQLRGWGDDKLPMTRSRWEKILEDQVAQKAASELEAQAPPIKDTEVDVTDRTLFASDDTLDAFSFHGRQLKVIVKGTWHLEGMPHERIVASTIYYYDTDPAIVDEGLKFRRGREEETDFPSTAEFRHESFSVSFRPEGEDGEVENNAENEEEDDAEEHDSVSDYPSDREGNWDNIDLPRYIDLGSVPTTNFTTSKSGTGRMLSFPNWIQHQVGEVSVAKHTPDGFVAKRKILCFFLVEDGEWRDSHGIYMMKEPTNPVLTTSDVPFQVRMTNIRTLRFLVAFICRHITGQILPAELVQLILDSEYWGISREDAERHRRSLMKDRVINAETKRWESMTGFSLCEH
ncbi:hypothetical protein DFH06DRAFT_1315428 [Mycena polygramma]|nr:hypothetical protein DFH06DRAFT_1315428 [Mycena polygramma]